MAISYPLSIPNNNVNKTKFRAINTAASSRSPFTHAEQVVAHSGQHWEVDVTLPPMDRDAAEVWIGWLLSLRGKVGTFLLGDIVGATARGSAGGTPLVNGGSQTGGSLVLDGATASQTGWLKAGDYIQLGSGATATLHKVLQDANSDGSGNVTLDLWPYIRSAPADNSTVVVSNAVGRFRLASNAQDWDINSAAIFGLTFGAVEAI